MEHELMRRLTNLVLAIGLVLALAASGESDDTSRRQTHGSDPASFKKSKTFFAGHRVLSVLRTANKVPTRYLGIKAILPGKNLSMVVVGRAAASVYDEMRGEWADLAGYRAPGHFESFEAIVSGEDGRLWLLDAGHPVYFDGTWHRLEPPSVSRSFADHFPGMDQTSVLVRILDPIRAMFSTKVSRIFFIRDDVLGAFDGEAWSEVAKPPRELEAQYLLLPEPKHLGRPVPTMKDRQHEKLRRALGSTRLIDQFLRKTPAGILPETYCGLVDKGGSVFLGADRAIFRLDLSTGAWSMYPLPNGLVQAAAAYEGRDGTIWFSDELGSVAAFDKRTHGWEVYSIIEYLPVPAHPKQKPPSPEEQALLEYMRGLAGPKDSSSVATSALRVRAMYEDRDNRLMLATQSGLVVFDQKANTWTLFTSKDSSLPSDRVSCLAEDHSGNIWIGTEMGIVILSR
ncbi:MAG: two-component regulator propeller domain-containing protein [Blastocatellia bacterium]